MHRIPVKPVGIVSLQESSPDAVFSFLDERVSRRGRDHWRWKYRLAGASASGSSSTANGRAFYHAGPDGSVGGFIGLMPSRLHTADAAVPAAWFVDWATAAGERSVGAGVGLLRHAQTQTAILLTLQGSPDTQKILPKLRWSAVDRPATWKLPLSVRYLADRPALRRHRWIRPLALAAGALGRLYFRPRRPGTERIALREVEQIPEDYDPVWNERRPEFAPLMERTSALLNFMCAEYPDGGYRRFLVLDGDRPAGHLVLRTDVKDGFVRGRIIDALWIRERRGMVERLVREACRLLAADGADYIECTASVPDLEEALRSCRFRRRSSVPIWYHRLPAGVPDPATWFITYLDCDRAYR